MSNIRIDNIAPSAGGTYRNAPRGIAAAWVNFNGTGTVAIRDSENVSSLNDEGNGIYSYNFSNNMTTANYVDVTRAADSTYGFVTISTTASNTSSKANIQTRNTSWVLGDGLWPIGAVMGDLA